MSELHHPHHPHHERPAARQTHGNDHAGHGHHHHDHDPHEHVPQDGRRLRLSLALTLGFAGVEAFSGWWAGSLALLGDASHMLTDSLALAVAVLAAHLARRPASLRHSYGLRRVEVLAALLNGVLMLVLVASLAWHAVERLLDPREIAAGAVTGVALLGLLVNLVVFQLLSHSHGDLNTRAALLHVMGDLLGSVAALASGLIVLYTGWTLADPLLSMLIGALILASTLSLLRQVLHTLFEGVPDSIALEEVGHAMAAQPGVRSVHDLHIWSLGSAQHALSAHVVLRRLDDWPHVLASLRTLLRERYRLEHVTLQPELPAAEPVHFYAKRPDER